MCGISGVLARDTSFDIPDNWIESMIQVQAHRGPDDAHSIRFPGCLLGFNRLSIQDLSLLGRQPMSVEGSDAAIVFNGEIYNFLELAETYRAQGISLRSRSDTEVLLRSYLLSGEECLQLLNGMFAFAVYDPARETLFAARDRFGVKPFYYFQNEEFFCFASEIKALLELPFVPRRPNLMALFGAAFERGNDRSQQTCFDGIWQLPPSHTLRIVRSAWSVQRRRYWSIQTPTEVDPQNAMRDPREIEEEFRALFRSAVSIRLRSDRPVGLLLSGGVDSSSIAAVIAETNLKPEGSRRIVLPKFFTMALPGEAMDESEVAMGTARFLGVPCHRIQSKSPQFERLIPATLWHNDEPLPYLNRCVHWQMMEEVASQGIIVVLNGQGGDETNGGYVGRLFGATLAMALQDGGITAFRREWNQAKRLQGYPSRWMISQLPKPFLRHSWLRTFRGLTRERAWRLARFSFIERGILRDDSPTLVHGDYVNDQLLRWLTRDTVPDLCHYEDRNSAAHGLEERFPFLDYRIAEFMFRLPWTFKIHQGVSKVLLRRAMTGIVPDNVLRSHRKIGLEVPVDRWVREPLATMIRDTVASRSFRERGIWRPRQLLSLIDRHLSGKANYGDLIWRIVSIELWYRMFIDSRSRAVIPGATRTHRLAG